MKPTVYIFMNKALGMSAGKLAAQAAHAMAYSNTNKKNWFDHPHRTILIMQARDDRHLESISDYLFERGIDTDWVVDEGVNEIDPHSVTALVTYVVDRADEKVQATLSTFELYRDTIRFNVEVDR